MASSLSGLPPENLLSIADYLGPDLTGLLDSDVQRKYGEDGNYAPSRDTILTERRKQSLQTLINWSYTSKYFRQFLAPIIFETVTLRNNTRSGETVNLIAQYPTYGSYVKEISFLGTAPGEVRREEPAFSDTEGILPKNVEEILSDLKRFPRLEALSVEFEYDFNDYEEWDEEGVDMTHPIEDMEQVKQHEESEAWRALMKRVWDAVSRNEAVVKRLVRVPTLCCSFLGGSLVFCERPFSSLYCRYLDCHHTILFVPNAFSMFFSGFNCCAMSLQSIMAALGCRLRLTGMSRCRL